MNNDNYTPEKWTKKRYEQCIRELEQYIITLQQQLKAKQDKEDKIREYCNENIELWKNDYSMVEIYQNILERLG